MTAGGGGTGTGTGTDGQDTGSVRETLARPGYRRLATAWTVGNIGDSALYITAAIWVKAMTGSDSLAALVFLALGVPAFFSPLFGLLADRFPRRNLLMVNNLATAAVVLLLLLVDSPDRLWLVYAVMVLYAGTAYVNASAQSGLLKDLLPARLLAPANGMFGSIDQALRIVAPLAGAAAFGVWGMAPIVVATAVCFVAGTCLLALVRVHESVHADPPGESWWQRTTAGFTQIHARPRLRRAILALTLLCAGGGITNSTVFATVDTGLGLPPEFLSVMVAVQGAVSVAAGLAAARIIRGIGYERTMLLGCLLFAVGFSAQAAQVLWVVVAGIVPFAAGIPLIVVAAITLRQQELPARVQGRGAAATQLVTNGSQTLTAGAAAALLGVVDYRLIIFGGVVLALAGTLPVLRRFPQPAGTPDQAGPDQTGTPDQAGPDAALLAATPSGALPAEVRSGVVLDAAALAVPPGDQPRPSAG